MSAITVSTTVDIGSTRLSGSVSFTQSATGRQGGVKNVGIAEETITIDSDLVATPRVMWIYNTDDTNFVEVGTSTGVYPMKFLAGDAYAIPIHSGTATVYLKADTAACEVEYEIIEA